MPEFLHKYFILNDQVIPVREFDEELVFGGRSVYDALRLLEGIPLFAGRHYQRTVYTAGAAGLKIWLNKQEVNEKMRQLIRANGITEGNIKLVFNYRDNTGSGNFLAYFVPHHYPDKHDMLYGIDTVFFQGERNNPNAKLIDRMLRESTEQAKSEHSVYEVILVDRHGFITEGSRSNIFFIQGDKILTTPLKDVLPGVTRSCIFEICRNSGIAINEENIHYTNAERFEAVFISGTSPGILPVRKMENYIYPANNILLEKIINEFRKMVSEYLDAHRN
ncbi:MAG: aminotransferase class IV [Bacteroidia bacterium]|nr:aminotransferase class IV [Bacteroidia bacterium]